MHSTGLVIKTIIKGGNMKIAIVGARNFPQLQLVEWFIRDLPKGITIISGGAKGVDSAAEQYAKQYGHKTEIILPNLTGCKERYQFAMCYHARNQQIVNSTDMVVAFLETERGGTWDTVKRAITAKKPIKVIKPSLFFPTNESDQHGEESEGGEESEAPTAGEIKKGAGPFQIRRVSLGSYALRRKLYIDSEEWAKIVTQKRDDPTALAKYMLPKFLEFFETNKRFGVIDILTTPPRSIRNLDSPHVMSIMTAMLASELGVEYLEIFKPWIKVKRGRFADKGEIEVTEAAKKCINKVVWVCDDITTTNYTLQSAVRSLMAIESHAHGLVYVLMA